MAIDERYRFSYGAHGIDKALEERNELLDKIRAEIDGIEINGQIDEHTMFIRAGEQVKQMALNIIDKYRKGANECMK